MGLLFKQNDHGVLMDSLSKNVESLFDNLKNFVFVRKDTGNICKYLSYIPHIYVICTDKRK
jgi:hypothetical protein